jgi:DUF4097 and DUF4098 domain-containing protein YvlB
MQFSTPTPVRLTVVNPSGSVTVEASERDTTEVVVNRKRGSDEEKVEVTHEDRGDHHEISINVPRHRGRGRLFGMLMEELDIAVQLPTGSSVTMTGATADLTVRGDIGRVEAKSASGDVRVERCTGGKMASVSGDVNVRMAEGECTTQTVSGDVRIGVLRGDLRGRTVSGDLVLECAVEGELSVGTVSGDVRIGIQRGSRLAVDANSASGDLSSEVDLSDDASPGDGPVVDVRVQTVSGDVRLVRADEAAPVA